MADKVYLLDVPNMREDIGTTSRVHAPGASHQAPRIPNLDDVPEAWVRQPATPSPAGRRPFKAMRTLVAVYTLGGIAPLALRVGPRKFAWAALSTLSLAGWATLVWYWSTVRAAMQSGRLPILPFLLALGIVYVVGAIAWSRAVKHVVRDERFQPQTLPRWLRHPWAAGVAGVLLPGSGLALAGRALRASLALWNAASVTFAALVLANASLLWNWNVKTGADAMPKAFVESLFMIAAAVVAGGSLLWIGTALDGARLAEAKRGSFRRNRARTTLVRGDAVTVAFVAALVTFVVAFHPGQMARDLDQFAGSMRFTGYRVIPLTLESVAARLDPGSPEYALRVAELQTDMGHPEAARVIHDRLRQHWEAYAQMLLQTAAAAQPTAPSRPISPARDLVPRSQDLARSLAVEPQSSPAQ